MNKHHSEESVDPRIKKLHKLIEEHEKLAIRVSDEINIRVPNISYEEAMGLSRQVILSRNKLIVAIIEANNEQAPF